MGIFKKKDQPDMVVKGPQAETLGQAFGITRTVVRPLEESDIQLRPDRIGKYFRKYLNRFVFVEFSNDFIEKSKAKDLLRGVPIPLRKKEVKEFAGGYGIDFLVLAENMTWVMGCDPHFKYTKCYAEILKKLYNKKLEEGMLREGRDAAERGEYDNACIHFRATLCINPEYLHGMYSYARVCREMYMASNNEEYVGRFKAEALDWFELLTETHPRFAQGFYYLGYMYLNMGLYGKANIAWHEFLRFTKNNKDRKEIDKRIKQITHPVIIEDGCLKISTGRYDEGLEILKPYLDSQYNDWWPLYYYLGVGYANKGKVADAVSAFKKVLTMNGSHLETMKELANIYELQGDKTNWKKYTEKIKLIEEAQEKDHKKQLAETQKEDKRLEIEEPKPAEPVNLDEPEEDEQGAQAASAVQATSKDEEEKKTIVKRLGQK